MWFLDFVIAPQDVILILIKSLYLNNIKAFAILWVG